MDLTLFFVECLEQVRNTTVYRLVMMQDFQQRLDIVTSWQALSGTRKKNQAHQHREVVEPLAGRCGSLLAAGVAEN